jgi:hypothetical protein
MERARAYAKTGVAPGLMAAEFRREIWQGLRNAFASRRVEHEGCGEIAHKHRV